MARYTVAIPLHMGKGQNYKLLAGEITPFGMALRGAVLDVDPAEFKKPIELGALVSYGAKQETDEVVKPSEAPAADKTVRRGKKGAEA